jgi:FtsZ-binding cell division protein ZapB
MTEEGKLLAHELIEALKGEVATLKAELFAAKSQRDVLLSENARLKTQVINLRGKR